MSQIEKIAFKTIGCKVNQYETGSLMNAFIHNGYKVVGFNDIADIYLLNTCAVTKEAERKSKQMVRKAARLNPSATIIVTGCAVQLDPKEFEECVNSKYLILGNDVKEKIFSIFRQIDATSEQKLVHFQSANSITSYTKNNFFSMTDRVRGFIKIQDGCNHFCSYCIIPYLRGRSRSRPYREVVSEIEYLISRKYQEIVLLGINLGSYGNDLIDESINLAKLVRIIEKIQNLGRIRLSSIELPYFTNEFMETLAGSVKICHHFHIPLQSGDNHILSLMRRKYTTEQFKKVIDKIRDTMADVAITTDVIVGFPGESEESFEKTLNFIQEAGFAKIHVFPYSERTYNLSSIMPYKVNQNDLKTRVKRLLDLSRKLHQQFMAIQQDKEKTILIESEEMIDNQKHACGITDNYIKVCVENRVINKGEMVKVKLKTFQDNYFKGECIH